MLGISFALKCVPVIDTVRICSWSYNGIGTDVISSRGRQVDREIKMNFFNMHPTLQPVTETWMLLNIINLMMEFVGLVAKIGITFIGFLDSLHIMGAYTVSSAMLLQVSSINTMHGRINHTFSTCCYSHKVLTNSIATHEKALKRIPK